jgi:hypothetical protein
MRKASLLRFISFIKQRLPKRVLARKFPEIMRVFKIFGPKSLQAWSDNMLHHNTQLRRGALMRLCRTFNTARLMHCSLDMYMLQMHSDEIAEALDCFSSFGGRVIPLITNSPDSEVWWLSTDVSIQRHHWFELCRRVMNIVHLLGLDMNVLEDFQDTSDMRKHHLNPWPGQTKMFESAKAAQEIFGAYAEAD